MSYYADSPYTEGYEFEEQAVPSSRSQGCLFLFFLPPLVVTLLGILVFGQPDIAETVFATMVPSATPIVVVAEKEKTTFSKVAASAEVKQTPVPELNKPSGELSQVFTPEVMFWEDKILAWGEQYGLDPNLIATVMQIESCGDNRATSSAGAMGLFQVMPYHFSAGENAYQPGTNALRGLNYLRQALTSGGSVRMAFAGYNGGISGASQGEAYWFAETRRYVYWGTGIYAAAQAGETYSSRLAEWLASGGASLCAQASRRQASE